jgi:hypothetical protein
MYTNVYFYKSSNLDIQNLNSWYVAKSNTTLYFKHLKFPLFQSYETDYTAYLTFG